MSRPHSILVRTIRVTKLRRSSCLERPTLFTTHQRLISSSSRQSLASPTVVNAYFTLSNGRKLGYHTSGPDDGTPVIYIHGHPDSGIIVTGPLEARIAEEHNIKWIGPDRPGVGISTPYDAQAVTDYPTDMKELVEHLNLPNFYMIGTSGGTGFTLACAKSMEKSRLKGVGICAGIGPVECGFDSMDETQLKALEAWRGYPSEFRQYYETEYVPLAQQSNSTVLHNRLRGEFEAAYKGKDREVMLEEENLQMATKSLRQAWIQGAWAHGKGMELHWRPWGFKLEDIAFPGIRLWYGADDVSTTPVMGKYMAERLTGSIYEEFPGDTHYTIWRDGNLQKMLRGLIHGTS